MRLLLDTHATLWFLAGDPRLSANARSLIEDKGNFASTSIASLWEIAIKAGLGKLSLSQPFDSIFPASLAREDIRILPVTVDHLATVLHLPLHHRDPFDRLLVAQSIVEGCQLVSRDDILDAYGIRRVW